MTTTKKDFYFFKYTSQLRSNKIKFDKMSRGYEVVLRIFIWVWA